MQSQSVCDLEKKIEFLNTNYIRAAIGNRGFNFHDGLNGSFRVPYTSGTAPGSFYITSLWFGGYNTDQKLLTNVFMNNTGDCGYIPGPFNDGDDQENFEMAQNWNRIFMVTGEDIKKHLTDFQDGKIDFPVNSIYGWPGNGNPFFKLMHGFDIYKNCHAGFIETPGHINGIYEPQFGEYPGVAGLSPSSVPGAIFWCVYSGGIYPPGNDIPYDGMKLQIEQTAWAMDCDDDILSKTVFTKYVVTNKNNSPYFSFRFGLFTDPDLGCYYDDYVGSFPSLNSYYVYNIDNNDDSDCGQGLKGYGANPPVQVVTFLGDNGLDGFLTPDLPSNSTTSLLQSYFYNILNGKFRDGTPITFGGNGNNPWSKDTVLFMFPDSPLNSDGWSMVSAHIPSGDKKALGINRMKQIPDFTFYPDSSIKYDIAFSFFRNEGFSNLENIVYAKLKLPDLIDSYKKGLPGCYTPVCNCNCVWPGDTDRNGIVNFRDYVNILRNLGKNGPERKYPVAWLGREASDWPQNNTEDINLKYIDANGDGTIDFTDIGIINDFMGSKNFCFNAAVDYCEEGDEIIMSRNNAETVLVDNRVEVLNLVLKNENNLLGLEYEIRYDSRLFKKFDQINRISWKEPNVKTYYFTNSTVTDETITHIIQINDMKTNLSLSEINNNKLLRLALKTNNLPDSFPTRNTQIKICNAIAYYDDGSKKYLPSQTIDLRLPDDVVITKTEEPYFDKTGFDFSVTPNPASSSIYVSCGLKPGKDMRLEIYDISGKFLYSELINGHNQKIDCSELKNGIYLFRIKSDEFIKTQKVVICK